MKRRFAALVVAVCFPAPAWSGPGDATAPTQTGAALYARIKDDHLLNEGDRQIIDGAAAYDPRFIEGAGAKALSGRSVSDFLAQASGAELAQYSSDLKRRAILQGFVSGVVPADQGIRDALEPKLAFLSAPELPQIELPGTIERQILKALGDQTLVVKPLCETGARAGAPCIPDDPYDPSRFKSVLAIYIDGALECSGVLLDATHVVTAAHCVLAASGLSKAAIDPARIKVGTPAGHRWSLTGTPSIPPDMFKPCLPDCPRTELYDFAVLNLAPSDTSLVSNAPTLRALHQSGSIPITIAGYGKTSSLLDRQGHRLRIGVQQLQLAAPTQAFTWDYNNGALSSACNGDSGGPIFAGKPRKASDPLELIGLMSHFVDGQNICTNTRAVAVNLSAPETKSLLCAYLNRADDFCRP